MSFYNFYSFRFCYFNCCWNFTSILISCSYSISSCTNIIKIFSYFTIRPVVSIFSCATRYCDINNSISSLTTRNTEATNVTWMSFCNFHSFRFSNFYCNIYRASIFISCSYSICTSTNTSKIFSCFTIRPLVCIYSSSSCYCDINRTIVISKTRHSISCIIRMSFRNCHCFSFSNLNFNWNFTSIFISCGYSISSCS